MPGVGKEWGDVIMEGGALLLGFLFICGCLYAMSGMSPKERDEFIIMMTNFALEQYD